MAAYYQTSGDSGILSGFRDLDSPAILDELLQHARSTTSQNFVVDFDDSTAHAAFDLPAASIERLLSAGRRDTSSTRWVNVWCPHRQQELLGLLACQYDFSPRLLGMMCSDPWMRRSIPLEPQSEKKPRGKSSWHVRTTASETPSDVERGSDELSALSSISSRDSTIAGGNFYRIVDDIWHYSSVDFGRNYVCVGYNSLYGTRASSVDPGDGLLPHCVRVWTWLVLCDDNTVISINEDAFPYTEGRLNGLQQRIVQETRRNLIDVFQSLSRVDEDARMAQNPIALHPLRTRLGETPKETAHRDADTPGLLFYYLFENFHNSYTLVTRKESRYGLELSSLRTQMFESPKLCHIDRLDSIGKELGVLKRHYQSYTRIIDRLLDPQTATVASLQGSQIVSTGSQVSLDTIRPLITEKGGLLGVSLSSAARVRFRRLKDLIDLYALSKVQEYLNQKDTLITLNFNLIAMKESLAMERLTRVTLLITKATILFLPISLMSAYFSVDLGNEEYTAKEYWFSFAVVLFCSWVALFVFGVFSGSVQTIDFFVALGRGLLKGWKACRSRVIRTVRQ